MQTEEQATLELPQLWWEQVLCPVGIQYAPHLLLGKGTFSELEEEASFEKNCKSFCEVINMLWKGLTINQYIIKEGNNELV